LKNQKNEPFSFKKCSCLLFDFYKIK